MAAASFGTVLKSHSQQRSYSLDLVMPVHKPDEDRSMVLTTVDCVLRAGASFGLTPIYGQDTDRGAVSADTAAAA